MDIVESVNGPFAFAGAVLFMLSVVARQTGRAKDRALRRIVMCGLLVLGAGSIAASFIVGRTVDSKTQVSRPPEQPHTPNMGARVLNQTANVSDNGVSNQAGGDIHYKAH